MSENITQDERWYRIEHRVSGFDAGFWAATSPDEAIARMMREATTVTSLARTGSQPRWNWCR